MFTPPASPLPPSADGADEKQEYFPPIIAPEAVKKATGRRTRWMVVLTPLALILITLSTRLLPHPAAFDVLSGSPLPWNGLSHWSLHKRHPANDEGAASTVSEAISATATSLLLGSGAPGVLLATSTSLAATAQPVPTIPTNPTLPDPFPAAFNSDITQNYASMTCYRFFSNMTSSASFKLCRPFSILLQTSNDFIDAQSNLEDLNTLVWATCNPPLGFDACRSNMEWFANALPTACAADVEDESKIASSTLRALQAYEPMYKTACESDPSSNTYCYVNAAHNSNPSDQYFYQLPLGISVPKTSTPSCSACTKSVMNVYANAYAENDALQKTYPAAQVLADGACGEGYAPTVAAASADAAPYLHPHAMLLVILLLTVFTLS
ncbi:hypothetical protein CYLTODRAFT_370623 [Cylindrobasidium torrendii FP15055 ss-10]|uniref:DUF7729 domain-containing protein n=1 Tax=Cylindrobasidium torrendii FP15055 ss-10 TaxID=1314674 RepID=A0A0D7BMA6_9AGAR|nr:hypothetical protein CYLTODRAFT_370623 [Cylindrobasidium torrendii FP15055 ss-10]